MIAHPRRGRKIVANGSGCARTSFLFLLVALIFSPPLQAVIFYSTGDPDYNTTPPTGALANSGWQWVGFWGGFQGVPIGPHYFLTARHVGGAVGEAFVLRGVAYPTTAFFDDPTSDLRIWQVSGTFSSWPLFYRGKDEVGKTFTVFGRGMIRGAEVRDAATDALRGWQWKGGDGRMRWGENVVAAIFKGDARWGPLLYAKFKASGGRNEAHLALGDSSGPIFVKAGPEWKLAGVAASVDSSFNTTNTGPGFSAAIFDVRGLYYGDSTHWKLVTGPALVCSGFYITRVSAHTDWIDGVIGK